MVLSENQFWKTSQIGLLLYLRMNAHFFDSMGDPILTILRHVDMEWVGMVVARKKKSRSAPTGDFPCNAKINHNFLEQHWGFHHGEMSIPSHRKISHPSLPRNLDRIDWCESGMWKRRHGRSGLEGDPQFPKKTFLVVKTLNGSWAKLRIPKLTDFYDH